MSGTVVFIVSRSKTVPDTFSPSILRIKHSGLQVQAALPAVRNLAKVASASTSFVSGHETIAALNDGFTPDNSNDKSHGAYGNWPQQGTQWVEYQWSQPIYTSRIEVTDRNLRTAMWDGYIRRSFGEYAPVLSIAHVTSGRTFPKEYQKPGVTRTSGFFRCKW